MAKTVKSSCYQAEGVGCKLVDGIETGGHLRIASAKYVAEEALASGDVIELVTLPAGVELLPHYCVVHGEAGGPLVLKAGETTVASAVACAGTPVSVAGSAAVRSVGKFTEETVVSATLGGTLAAGKEIVVYVAYRVYA